MKNSATIQVLSELTRDLKHLVTHPCKQSVQDAVLFVALMPFYIPAGILIDLTRRNHEEIN